MSAKLYNKADNCRVCSRSTDQVLCVWRVGACKRGCIKLSTAMSVVKFVLRILLNWGKGGGGGVQDAKLTAGKENQCEVCTDSLQ